MTNSRIPPGLSARAKAFMERAHYVTAVPRRKADIPEGEVLCHNFPPTDPHRGLTVGGFRAWTEPLNDEMAECPCAWAERIAIHYCYRVRLREYYQMRDQELLDLIHERGGEVD